ncbi:MAG: hypothetical protein LWX01_06080 [Deltaproteobacteria bacterium]|nr:hypothetical protein [Deltaproteobacteria bacterium]MDL1961255.1 hypothetical protein [Deltaproteobacteria bacterium]
MSKNDDQYQKNIKQSLIDLAVESWRFSRLFSRLLDKLDAGESSRYVNQHRFYLKRLIENLKQAGIRLVNVEGQVYDIGMAATALNAEDFDPDDNLVVDQMLEPIIMEEEGLVRTGTVILRKVEL